MDTWKKLIEQQCVENVPVPFEPDEETYSLIINEWSKFLKQFGENALSCVL